MRPCAGIWWREMRRVERGVSGRGEDILVVVVVEV